MNESINSSLLFASINVASEAFAHSKLIDVDFAKNCLKSCKNDIQHNSKTMLQNAHKSVINVSRRHS